MSGKDIIIACGLKVAVNSAALFFIHRRKLANFGRKTVDWETEVEHALTEARHYRVDRDGVCLLKHATSAEVQKATGFSGARIWTCAAYGRRLGGIYDIWFDDRDTAEKEGEFGEKEARRKFGDKNYEEWCAMNRRYGKKSS